MGLREGVSGGELLIKNYENGDGGGKAWVYDSRLIGKRRILLKKGYCTV